MRKDVAELLHQTWQSPVFGDSFGLVGPEGLAQAKRQLSEIAGVTSQELCGYIMDASPDIAPADVAAVVSKEILPKTTAFCPALTVGEINDGPRLSSLATAVGLMYWADQSMDRGDRAVQQAVEWLTADDESAGSVKVSAPVGAAGLALQSLTRIAHNVGEFARPEDAPYVLNCFYDQVLQNEARMRRLSDDYLAAANPYNFLGERAEEIVQTVTVNAGFPSISSSLYAIYRHHRDWPALADVYADPHMTALLQACNATVRLWDELGDWKMDRGDDPATGIFTINLCNEYHPKIIAAFSERAGIYDAERLRQLQESCADFYEGDNTARPVHVRRIETIMLEHIRDYMHIFPRGTARDFAPYIGLCKRVLEIGYVNRIGDIALMAK